MTKVKEEIHINFYDENEKEIGRKTYSSYGAMIYHAKRHAKKIGASFFYHIHYLRRFEVEKEDD